MSHSKGTGGGWCRQILAWAILATACWLVAVVPAAGSGGGGDGPGEPALADYERSWLLVRLAEPLSGQRADFTFPLQTGLPELDAVIEESGVHRIDHALFVSAQDPKNPEAFRRYGFDRTYRFHVPIGTDVLSLVERLERLGSVVYAEPDYLAVKSLVPNDPRYVLGQQWNLDIVDAPAGWDITTGSTDVVIAINDSGADVPHEDLHNKLDPGWNFSLNNDDVQDTHGHGTGVSSVGAADTNNGLGMAGMCWGCRIMPVRRASDSHSDCVDAMVWAADHGARIINGSYGTTSGSSTLRDGVGYVADAGVIQFNSSGNWTADKPHFPANYKETLAIGATNADDERASWSNWGSRLDVVAPGEDVLAARLGGGYEFVSGTSYASPLAAGLAGLVHSVNPATGREEMRHLIRAGAEDEVGLPSEDTPGFDIYHGWGRVNVDRTLQAAESGVSLRVENSAATRLFLTEPNPWADSYDFVRGDLAALVETPAGVDLGALVCLENDSLDPDTAGDEDTETPAAGDAFFYLARFNAAPGAGSYGGSSLNRDRVELRRPDWTVLGGQAGAFLGGAAGPAGDVNGDGYADLIVASEQFDTDDEDAGRVDVYLGGPDGLSSTPVWTEYGENAGDNYGWSAVTAGDVNGDGYDDVVVSAIYYDGAFVDEGRVYVYHGSPTGPGSVASWVMDGGQAESEFGGMAYGTGDVNGDGFDDLIIGAPAFDNGQEDEGRVSIYLGSSSGLAAEPVWEKEGEQAGALLSARFSPGGDVNGDGIGDVVIGALRFDAPETDEGRAWVYLGSPAGPELDPFATLEIDQAGAEFGSWVGSPGDLNADGYDDIAVTAMRYDGGHYREGAVFVYHGSPSGLSSTPDWSVESDQENAYLGGKFSMHGDLTGDGIADLIVGAMYYDTTRNGAGKAWIYSGSAAGPPYPLSWSLDGTGTGSHLGHMATVAGDLDGDGRSDLLVSEPFHRESFHREGRANVYYAPLPEESDCPK